MSELKQVPIKISQEAYAKALSDSKEKGISVAKHLAALAEHGVLNSQFPADDLSEVPAQQSVEQPTTEAEQPEPYVYRGL